MWIFQLQPQGCRRSVHILSGAWGTHPQPDKLESLWTGSWMASFWLMYLVCHLTHSSLLHGVRRQLEAAGSNFHSEKLLYLYTCITYGRSTWKKGNGCIREWSDLEKTHFQCSFYNNFMCLIEQRNIPVGSPAKQRCDGDISPDGLQWIDNAVLFLEV